MPSIKNLECSRCQHTFRRDAADALPQCKGPLYVRYDLQLLRGIAARDAIARDAAKSPWLGMWRYRAVLPDARAGHPRRRLDADASPAAAIPAHF